MHRQVQVWALHRTHGRAGQGIEESAFTDHETAQLAYAIESRTTTYNEGVSARHIDVLGLPRRCGGRNQHEGKSAMFSGRWRSHVQSGLITVVLTGKTGGV